MQFYQFFDQIVSWWKFLFILKFVRHNHMRFFRSQTQVVIDGLWLLWILTSPISAAKLPKTRIHITRLPQDGANRFQFWRWIKRLGKLVTLTLLSAADKGLMVFLTLSFNRSNLSLHMPYRYLIIGTDGHLRNFNVFFVLFRANLQR